ncbi:MAG: HD domain-containing phosphohydrolase [Pseudomonadota bacterium]
MNPDPSDMPDADDDFFAAEVEAPVAPVNTAKWKVLIVDDDRDVHSVTKIIFKDFSFDGMGIELIHAYSGAEACALLRRNPDTAAMLLDVVMETNDAGLVAVKYIREELKNKMVRIILRTGQPGHAPEALVVVNYDINDYKNKTDLTPRSLFTSMMSALRSFRDLQTIDTSRRGLTKLLDAATNMDYRSRNLFASALLAQLGLLIEQPRADMMLLRQAGEGAGYTIMAATGVYDCFVGDGAVDALDAAALARVAQVFASGAPDSDADSAISLVRLPELYDVALFLGKGRPANEAGTALIDMFCMKIVLAYENFEFVEQARKDQHVELALLAGVTANAHYLPVVHALNRGRVCAAIVTQMKQDGAAVEHRLADLIERAAVLADIGNHAIPAAVLEAPGPLSPSDLALVRSHPERGAARLDEVLGQIAGGRVAQLARQLILSHHECFDGSGYPAQLAGEHIPLAGRVAAVADCYLALTSERPWRAAFTHETALTMLGADSGKKFDPQVLKAFLAVADAYRSGEASH